MGAAMRGPLWLWLRLWAAALAAGWLLGAAADGHRSRHARARRLLDGALGDGLKGLEGGPEGGLEGGLRSPAEMAWDAWLLMERPPLAAATPAPPSAHGVEVGVSRRRASRTLFVAPPSQRPTTPPPCPKGFLHNAIGGCHEIIIMMTTSKPEVAKQDSGDLIPLEGSGEPLRRSDSDEILLRLKAHRNSWSKTLGSQESVRSIYSVLKMNGDSSASNRKSRRAKIVPSTNEEFWHKIPIIGGEEDQELPFSQVRVRGID